jgi:rare lipoprotein A
MAAGAAALAVASTAAWATVSDAPSTSTMATAGLPVTSLSPSPSATSAKAAKGSSPDTRPTSGSSSSSSKPSKSSDSSPSTADSPNESSTKRPKPTSTEKPRRSKSESSGPRVVSAGTCGASYYGEPQMTASGEQFNPSAMTAAHKTLPLGSKVRVTNPDNGESVTVRINDRGPYIGGRCLDLSEAAFEAIGNTDAGVMTVKYEVLAS